MDNMEAPMIPEIEDYSSFVVDKSKNPFLNLQLTNNIKGSVKNIN